MTAGFTAALAERSALLQFADLPGEVVEVARQCVLDWFGVTLAGAGEPAAQLILEVVAGEGHADRGLTVVGRATRLPPRDAALVNGTASHALDFDDVNTAMLGHPSVAVLAALLVLAEDRHRSGTDTLTAFAAGYETECRVARAVGGTHYLRGFHATGTVGTFGSAAACAHLLGLDATRTATALGLAATQAAGLKSMFGTMAKPFHAGKACANGLLAALLAAQGFTAHGAAVEAEQGFAEATGGDFDGDRGLADPDGGWHLRHNLFKYHAACFETHSTIEGLRRLRDEHGVAAGDVAAVVIRANPMQLRMCAIPDPTTGLEVKFSLRHLAAMTLLGVDTAAVASYTDDAATDPATVALRARVEVADDGPRGGGTPVEVELAGGRRLDARHDVSVPEADISLQGERLMAKFRALAEPVIGADRASVLADAVAHMDEAPDVAEVMVAAAAPG